MALIRLLDKVPQVYIDDSRDFLLFCRLFDVIINGLKYDIDGIERLINTKYCKSTILLLLQTKLGFFTGKVLTDDALRYILSSFILLERGKKTGNILDNNYGGKGTETAIKEAVYLFLKINGLETNIRVDIINGTPTEAQKIRYGQTITDHSIVIGIESSVRDTTPLYEVLKYIIPFGYNLFFYFYSGVSSLTIIYNSLHAKILYVSNDINSMISGSLPPTEAFLDGKSLAKYWDPEKGWYTSDFLNRHINSINSAEVIPLAEIKYMSESYRPIVKPGTENTLNIEEIEDTTTGE